MGAATYCLWDTTMNEVLLVLVVMALLILCSLVSSLLKTLHHIKNDTNKIEAVLYREERRQQAKR